MVRDVTIPDEGLTLDAFASLTTIMPTHAEMAARYLHRRKLIWMSVQRGHARVYPASMSPGRGRPLGVRRMQSAMPTQVVGLMTDMLPILTNIAVAMSKMPSNWQDDPGRQANIRRSVEADAATVMKDVRRFIEERGWPAGRIRDYLWMTFPSIMAVVVETQPDLAQGEEPLSSVPAALPKKIPANLPPYDRVHAYVEAAGIFGIAVYEVARATNGKLKREEIEEIAERLEDMGMLHRAEARTANRGPKGMRLYSAKHGMPLIGSDGRRIPPLSMAS
jgi:hypothetical protein